MSLYESIINVMKEVGYVQKGGRVEFGQTKYKYAGEADLIAALRPAMVEHGIIMFCSGIDEIVNTGQRVLARYRFTLSSSDGNECIHVYALGEGMDSGDKAAYKAATGALKYALRQTFIIETGDDPDKDASEKLVDDEYKAERKRRQEFKDSVRVEYTEVFEWGAEIETLFENCTKLHELKAIYDANKKGFEMAEKDDSTVVEALREAYKQRADTLK